MRPRDGFLICLGWGLAGALAVLWKERHFTDLDWWWAGALTPLALCAVAGVIMASGLFLWRKHRG